MFLLLLIGLGAAGVKAQVRIGGNTPPNPAAALDLNAAEGTTTGTKGLALPRVTLGSNIATLDGTTTNITGMLVYNTGGSLSTGVYYWSGTSWNRVDGATLGGDTIVGNEVTNATAGGGLVRGGSGTAAAPYTLGIATGGVTAAMLASGAANDADYVVGNEVTDATSGGGLVRAGSGTSASPFTLGVAPGGVSLSMLAPASSNGAMPVYFNGAWRTASFTDAGVINYVVSATSNTGYMAWPALPCVTPPIPLIQGIAPYTPVTIVQASGSFLIYNGTTTTTNVNVGFWCWVLN